MRLVVVGAGGHGRETLDVVEAATRAGATWEFLGFVDDGPLDEVDLDRLARRGATVLGPVEALASLDAVYVVAIGEPSTRAAVVDRLERAGFEPAPPLVHPGAVLGADVECGRGTVVAAGSHLTTNVRVGAHVMVNVGCVLSHDTLVRDFATLSPAVILNGDVVVGERAFLGTGAVVVRGHSIGSNAVVGAGAVVISDVEDHETVVGVPAHSLRPE